MEGSKMENVNETVVKEEVKAKENNKKNNKKEKKNKNETVPLTYSLADKLDILFPQFKPSKKKEEDK
jgi:hypothetical protein